MSVVEVKNLSKSFLGNVVFNDISFRINKGSLTALLGKNGSGKSTILNILMGQTQMDKGDCSIFGDDIRTNPFHIKDKIGHVSEKIRFDYPLTMEEFIPQYGSLFSNFDFEVFKRHAKAVNIDIKKQFGEYSRGQKMQIVLISALAQNPVLLLIDEVTSVLDAYSRAYFMSVLKQFTAQGGTVIITTNIVNEVQYHCSDVIFLSENNIKFQTPLAEIPANFIKVRTHSEHPERLKGTKAIWSGFNSDGSQSFILPAGHSSLIDHKEILEDKRAVTLEDLYIYYSQGGEK